MTPMGAPRYGPPLPDGIVSPVGNGYGRGKTRGTRFVGMAEATKNIQAMVVGTSDVVATRIKAILQRLPAVDVAAEARDGVDAVSKLRQHAIDVIFIDIGDPQVKPTTDLSRLRRVDADIQIVMVATLTFANVKNAMAGLVGGAAEFVQAPSKHTPHIVETDFNRQIADLAQGLGRAHRDKSTRVIAAPAVTARFDHPEPAKGELRKRKPHRPKAIAIASSTGGPQALFTLFGGLAKDVRQPIFLTQHMPAGFTTALADHIGRRAGWPCLEATDGMAVEGGNAYMAPGGFHMVPAKGPTGPVLRINEGPEENFCRPSAEPMMRGVIDVYGAENVLMVVLTGMGSDGKAGAKAVADGGGTVVVQDKDSSIVWGMPGAVAVAGDCHAVLPIGEIADFIGKVARGQ